MIRNNLKNKKKEESRKGLYFKSPILPILPTTIIKYKRTAILGFVVSIMFIITPILSSNNLRKSD